MITISPLLWLLSRLYGSCTTYLILVSGAVLLSCDPSSTSINTYDLSINFSQMQAVTGKSLTLSILDDSDVRIADTTMPAVPPQPFVISFTGVLNAGQSYKIEMYVDNNNNSVYDQPPIDPSWTLHAMSVSKNISYLFSYNRNFSRLTRISPSQYKLKLNITDIKPVLELTVGVRDNLSGQFLVDTTITPSGVSASLALPSVFVSSRSYSIEIFQDLNQNSAYDAPPLDDTWLIPNINLSSDSTLDFSGQSPKSPLRFPPDSLFHLILQFSDLSAYKNKMLYYRLTDVSTGEVRFQRQIPQVQKELFSDTVKNRLAAGHAYQLQWFVDTDDNLAYTLPPADVSWLQDLPPIVSNTVLSVTPATGVADNLNIPGDSVYSVEIKCNGLDSLKGLMLRAFLIDTLTNEIVARDNALRLTSGATTFRFNELLQKGETYRIDIYADLNQSGIYEKDADKAWTIAIPPLITNAVYEFSPSAPLTKLTSLFEPNFSCDVKITDLAAYAGLSMRFRVRDRLYDKTLVDSLIPVLSGSDFSWSQKRLMVMARSYSVEYAIDINGNGLYDAPPKDYAWRRTISNISENVAVTYPANDELTDIGLANTPPRVISIVTTGLAPDSGRALTIRVKDAKMKTILTTRNIPKIELAPLITQLSAHLIKGRMYLLDYHVDVNGNNIYDQPPTDHAWRLVFQSKADTTRLFFNADSNYFDFQ